MSNGSLMLEIDNLHARLDDGREILKGVDPLVGSGEVHAIMGPNGSGKSTLAAVLAGRDGYQVTEGTVRYLGRDLLAMPDAATVASPSSTPANSSVRSGPSSKSSTSARICYSARSMSGFPAARKS